ncbi:unnamed protein product [Prunus armeniaca]
MSGTPIILPFIAYSHKHAVNPTNLATRTRASITTTKGSAFHTSSQKSAWIIDSGSTDHMTFNLGQLISRKSSTPSVVSNANGTPSLVVGEGSLSLSTSLQLNSVFLVPSLDHNLLTSSQERRLVVVLGRANSTTWTGHRIVRSRLVKLSQPVELILKGRGTKFGYGINVLGMPRSGPTKIATPTGAR